MKAAGNTQTICDINSYKYTRTHTHSHAYLCFALRTICICICIFSCNYSLGHICSCISPRGHLLISRSICIVCRCCSLPLFLSLCPVSFVRVQHVNSFRISCSELVNILFVYFPNFPPSHASAISVACPRRNQNQFLFSGTNLMTAGICCPFDK